MGDNHKGGGYPPSSSSYSGGVPHPPPHPPPANHTLITVKTNPNPNSPQVVEINLNLGYFKTLPGILKLVQLVIGIVCMACAAPARALSGPYYSTGHNHFFLAVVVIAFIVTLLWTFFYFLQVKDSIRSYVPCSWLALEFYSTAISTLFYFIAFIVILAGFGYCVGSSWCDVRVAAGVFGIFNTIAYGLSAYIAYNDYKATPPELQ